MPYPYTLTPTARGYARTKKQCRTVLRAAAAGELGPIVVERPPPHDMRECVVPGNMFVVRVDAVCKRWVDQWPWLSSRSVGGGGLLEYVERPDQSGTQSSYRLVKRTYSETVGGVPYRLIAYSLEWVDEKSKSCGPPVDFWDFIPPAVYDTMPAGMYNTSPALGCDMAPTMGYDMSPTVAYDMSPTVGYNTLSPATLPNSTSTSVDVDVLFGNMEISLSQEYAQPYGYGAGQLEQPWDGSMMQTY